MEKKGKIFDKIILGYFVFVFLVFLFARILFSIDSSSEQPQIVFIAMISLVFVSAIYCLLVALVYKHRNFVMNIFDGIVGLFATNAFVVRIIYDINIYYFYSAVGIFLLLPLLYALIDKEKIDSSFILRIVTRIIMIATAYALMHVLKGTTFM